MSASSRIIFALFPPSSRVTLFTVSDASFETLTPAAVEPVKLTISTSGCEEIDFPISLPCPETKLNTPLGSPQSCMISARMNAFSGASLDGFSIIVQPEANAGATFPII